MVLGRQKRPQRAGAAVYYLHHGTILDDRFAVYLRKMIASTIRTGKVYSLSARSEDGAKIKTFYGVLEAQLPVLLIAHSDDRLVDMYESDKIPPIDQLLYTIKSLADV